MARNGIYLARAREQIAQQRAENEREHRRRVDDAYRRVPGLRALDQTLQQQMIALVGLTMRHGSDPTEELRALERANLDTQAQRAELLTAYHLPVDYTDDIYTCPRCHDTGYVQGQPCECLLRRYNAELTRDLSRLLQHGAAKVYAVDVGKEQLHERMRRDPRVISMEGTNLRTAPEELIPEPVDIIVADVSFISLTLILPPCVRWLKEGGLVAALVKPQFELGPHQTDKGVVRDPALRQQAVDKVLLFCQERLGLECLGVVPAAVKGPKGNQEYIVCLRRVGAGQVACGSEVEQ